MNYQKVINSLFLYFAILALCVPGISKDKTVESTWAATPVTIDGSNNDWEGGTLTLEKKVKVDYAFRNDSENLYVLFIFKEPRKFMSTISYTGMTIWLNTEGKKKKNYGIKFQIKTVTADNYIALLEKMMGPMPEEKKKQVRSKPTYRIYHNEVIDKKGDASLIATGPITPAFSSKGGREMATYEFRIPLKRGEGQPVGIGTEPGKTVKIGFEWGGLTEELKKQKLAQQTGRGTRGISGAATREATDARRVSSTTGSMSSIRKGAKKHSFWADVKLAQNK